MLPATNNTSEYELVSGPPLNDELYRMSIITDIAVDFDGTCVDHRYPNVGQTAPYAVEALQYLQNSGRKLYLYTVRGSNHIQAAINWFAIHGIRLNGIQENPYQKTWTNSPKICADLYIDDRAFGAPLIHPPGFHNPVINWELILDKFKNADTLFSASNGINRVSTIHH